MLDSVFGPIALAATLSLPSPRLFLIHDARPTPPSLPPSLSPSLPQIEVALFRVRQLNSPKIRYKIDVNAQQSGLSGREGGTDGGREGGRECDMTDVHAQQSGLSGREGRTEGGREGGSVV